MEITRTITKKYHIEFYPNAFDCTVGDFISQRERMGISTQGFKTCFICGRRLAMDRKPIVINVSGKGNRFACDRCYKENKTEEEHEKAEL